MTHSSVHTSCALFLPSTNIPPYSLFTSLRLGTLMLLPWKNIVSRISLVDLVFVFVFTSRLPCFRLRFRFHGRRINGRCSENAAPFERFRPGKSPVGEFFIKICLPRGRGEKELVWLRDPCKICHLNVCNVLRMHRDFLGNFFPPATRGVFPVNSSEVLRRFVNSCGNIANASNGDGAKGGKWGREGESW